MRATFALFALIVAVSAADPLTPGKHLNLTIPGKREAWSWNAYLPRQYADPDAKAMPAVFLSSPKGNPGLGGLEEWSESRGVIIIGINGTANGQTFDTIHLIQDATYGNVLERVRIHPLLRFASGGSGGGRMSHHLAMRHADDFAGVFMQIMSESPPLPKHMAVGYWLGEKDENIPIAGALADVEATRRNGNAVRCETHPGGHSGAPREKLVSFLDWMLTVARATHPKLAPAERAAWLAEAKARLETEPPDEAEAERRRGECAALLALPAFAKSPAAAPFAAAWYRLSLAPAERESDAWKRHGLLLALSEDPALAAVDAAARKELSGKLGELRKDPAVKGQWAAQAAWRQINAAEQKAGAAKGRLGDVAKQYAELAKRHPDAEYGVKAKADAERIAAGLMAR